MKNLNELQTIMGKDVSIVLQMKGERKIDIHRAVSHRKGAFKEFWNEYLIPYCQENNINIITLTDSQTTDRDVWGEDYGFSGKKHCGTRNVYLDLDEDKRTWANNTLISFCISAEDEDGFEFMYNASSLLVNNKQTLSKEDAMEICKKIDVR